MPSKSNTERIQCNTCRQSTFHRTVGAAEDSGREDDTGFSWLTMFAMLQCCWCGEVVLGRIFRFSENQEDEVRYFPPKDMQPSAPLRPFFLLICTEVLPNF